MTASFSVVTTSGVPGGQGREQGTGSGTRLEDVTAAVGKGAARRHPAGIGHGPWDEGQILMALQAPVEPGHGTQQALRVGHPGRLQHRHHIALLDDAPGIHHHHPIGDLCHHAQIVGDEQDRHAGALLQILEKIEDLRLDGDVECGRRLVGDQQFRVAGQGLGDHRALPFAAVGRHRHGRHRHAAFGAGPVRGFAWTLLIGVITSGGFGPTLNAPIAMGYVRRDHSDDGTKLSLMVRGKPLPATVVPLPFVPHTYAR